MGASDLAIVDISLQDALADGGVRHAVERIADASYRNAPDLLEQEFAKNNHVYLARAGGAILGYFMVGWSPIPGIDSPTVFLGLSCVDPISKGHGIGKRLYQAFFGDALNRAAGSTRIVWWAHTATPASINGVYALTKDFSPRPDGSYLEEHLKDLDCIETCRGMTPYRCATHPFVLRGYAKARYNREEANRIASLDSNDGYQGLLARLKIDEAAGDRLMVVGEIKTTSSSYTS